MCLWLEMVLSDLHLLTLAVNATPKDFKTSVLAFIASSVPSHQCLSHHGEVTVPSWDSKTSKNPSKDGLHYCCYYLWGGEWPRKHRNTFVFVTGERFLVTKWSDLQERVTFSVPIRVCNCEGGSFLLENWLTFPRMGGRVFCQGKLSIFVWSIEEKVIQKC